MNEITSLKAVGEKGDDLNMSRDYASYQQHE